MFNGQETPHWKDRPSQQNKCAQGKIEGIQCINYNPEKSQWAVEKSQWVDEWRSAIDQGPTRIVGEVPLRNYWLW